MTASGRQHAPADGAAAAGSDREPDIAPASPDRRPPMTAVSGRFASLSRRSAADMGSAPAGGKPAFADAVVNGEIAP